MKNVCRFLIEWKRQNDIHGPEANPFVIFCLRMKTLVSPRLGGFFVLMWCKKC